MIASKSFPRSPMVREESNDEGEVNNASNLLIATNDVELSPAEELPAEMFYQIFNKLDKKSLKNSREVCKTWRNAIDDNPKLFTSYTFTIVDINEFLNSQLASKVKSVRFIQPLNGSEKSLENFFKKIASTVEEIYFTFGAAILNFGRMPATARTFRMMLRYCTKLNSLTITSADNNYDFIKDYSEDGGCNLAFPTVQKLSVNMSKRNLDDSRKLFTKLPNLIKLELDCDDVDFSKGYCRLDDSIQESLQKQVPDMIIEHLRSYNGKLQEISLKNVEGFRRGIFTKLLLTVGQLYPNTIFKGKINLNGFLHVKESEDIQVNQTSCRAIKEGLLDFHGEGEYDFIYDYDGQPIDTSKIGFCSNLHYLEILIEQRTSLVNLGFIKQLEKLTYLKILDRRFEDEEEDDNFLNQVFSSGIPSLKTLEFDGEDEGLGLNSCSWHLCFPNITKLYIKNYSGRLRGNFIYKLTKLEQLKSLTLEDLEKLKDDHLIGHCEVDGKISERPVIADFKALRHLHIADCRKLTDECLTNGLALCTKLEKITLCYIKYGDRDRRGKFTRTGLRILQQSRNYLVENLADSHRKKHDEMEMEIPQCKFKRFTIRR